MCRNRTSHATAVLGFCGACIFDISISRTRLPPSFEWGRLVSVFVPLSISVLCVCVFVCVVLIPCHDEHLWLDPVFRVTVASVRFDSCVESYLPKGRRMKECGWCEYLGPMLEPEGPRGSWNERNFEQSYIFSLREGARVSDEKEAVTMCFVYFTLLHHSRG